MTDKIQTFRFSPNVEKFSVYCNNRAKKMEEDLSQWVRPVINNIVTFPGTVGCEWSTPMLKEEVGRDHHYQL